MQENLTGVWHGLYNYPRYLQPVYFVATLIAHGNSFSGMTHEAHEGKSGAALKLFASLEGTRNDQSISFMKRYDGTGDWQHVVQYEGTLSSDHMEIEGQWSIPGNWSGRFLMIRNPGATEAVVRKVYENAG